MYAVVIKFQVATSAVAPSAELLGEAIRRVRSDAGRVEHATVLAGWGEIAAVAFVTARDADTAVRLGHVAATAAEQCGSAVRTLSVRLGQPNVLE